MNRCTSHPGRGPRDWTDVFEPPVVSVWTGSTGIEPSLGFLRMLLDAGHSRCTKIGPSHPLPLPSRTEIPLSLLAFTQLKSTAEMSHDGSRREPCACPDRDGSWYCL
jgi:hypothetical protein